MNDDERRIDYDLRAAIDYNLSGEFDVEDIDYVLASCFGENDGPDYWWLIAMKDHTYAVINGGCDYTGWDCQSRANFEIFLSLSTAVDSLPEKSEFYGDRLIRESIERQLTGKLTYGEVLQS